MDTFLTFISDNWLLMGAAGMSVLIAALSAAAETALVLSNKAHLQQLAETGNRRAAVALELVQERDGLHATLLLAENFFIVLSAVIGTVVAIHAFAYVSVAALVTVTAMSAIVVFIAKLVPKGLACRNPDGFALAAAPSLRAAVALLSPAARFLVRTADVLAGPGPQGVSCSAAVTEEDIKAMINLGEERGSLKEEEKELLHKVFEFGDTLASQAMRPRTEIVSVPSNVTLQEVFALVSEHGFSRYPVIEDTVDTVIGTLYIKDILVAMAVGRGEAGRRHPAIHQAGVLHPGEQARERTPLGDAA